MREGNRGEQGLKNLGIMAGFLNLHIMTREGNEGEQSLKILGIMAGFPDLHGLFWYFFFLQ